MGYILSMREVDLRRIDLSLLWHTRHQDEPRHIWPRRTIAAAATALMEEPAASAADDSVSWT